MFQDEHPIAPEPARSIIEAQFPELAPVHLVTLGEGWDNVVFRVNGDWVFRFPRRKLGVDCLRHEFAVTPHLETWLPLPISTPRFIGHPSEEFPHPFAGYAWIEGRAADAANPDDPRRALLAEPLGRFLRKLHCVPTEEARSWGAPGDLIGRLDMARRGPVTLRNLEMLRQSGLLTSVDRLADFINRMVRDFTNDPARDSPGESARHSGLGTSPSDRHLNSREVDLCLLHGDLYARHLLLDGPGRLAGVIDWGDVHIGDRAVDLAIAISFLPADSRNRFVAAYGPIDSLTWGRARFRAIQHSAVTAVFAYKNEDRIWLRESLGALERAATDQS